MKVSAKYLYVGFLISLILIGCKGKESVNPDDFNSVAYSPRYSTGFDVKGAVGKESTLLTVKNPWQGASDVVSQLYIQRNGEPVPDGFSGQVLDGDAQRIVAMSSTHVAMLDAVGAVDRIVGVSGLDYISNADINQRGDSIGDIGYEGNINYELLLSLDPDIVLLYGMNGASPMESKLQELDIPYMYVGDYLEESPLGKAEWLVALSEIVGKRQVGETVFAGIPQRYNSLKEKAGSVSTDLPKVILNAPYGGSWFMPSTKSYAALLVSDAGGELVYNKNTGNASMPVDMEEAYTLLSQADMWLNVGTVNSLDELKKSYPKFADAPCVAAGRIYNNNKRTNPSGGNDYFESAVVNPDLVLRDLIKIFHPELISEDFVYYKQIQ